MFLRFLAFALCFPIYSFSQDILWAHQSEYIALYEGASPARMEIDHAGNLIVLYGLGGRAKFEGQLFQSNGSSDILLIKYNADGMIIWTRQMGGASWDAISDLAIDSKNNILMTALMPQGGDFIGKTILSSNGTSVMAKIDTDGNLIWLQQLGGVGAIATDHDDNVFAGVSLGSYTVAIEKFTSDGTMVWQKKITEVGCCIGPSISDIRIDPSSNVIVTGTFFGGISFLGKTLQSSLYSVFIVKMDNNGNYLWSNQIDTLNSILNDVVSTGLEIDGSGNVYITGYFNQQIKAGSFNLTEKNPSDDRTGYLAKLNSIGGGFDWVSALYGADLIPSCVRINPQNTEVNVCFASLLWFNYNDQYFLTTKANRNMILSTDLAGVFKRTFFIKNEAYASTETLMSFDGANDFYVAGNFDSNFSAGCFDLIGGDFTSYLFKSGPIPDMQIDYTSDFCLNDTIHVTANGNNLGNATKFDWSFPSGVTSLTNSFETTVNYIDVKLDQSYTNAPFTVVPYFQCYPRTEFGSAIKQFPIPAQPSPPQGDTIICNGKTYTYTSPQKEDIQGYLWTTSANLTKQKEIDNSILLTPSVNDQYGYLQVQAFNQCGASPLSIPVKIRLNPVPQKPVVNGVEEVCAGQQRVSYTTSASKNALRYSWRFQSSLKVASVNSDSSSVFLTFPTDKLKMIIQSTAKGFCESTPSDPFEISIVPMLPKLSTISGDTAVCLNTSNHIYSVEPIAPEVSYHWTYPQGFSSTKGSTNSITISDDNTAKSGLLEVFASNKCFNSSSQTLSIKIHTLADKPIIKSDKCNTTLAYEGNAQFIWFKDNLAINHDLKHLELIDSGKYKLEIHNFCGSVFSDEIVADPVIPENIFIPNVITPNNDDKNERFIIDHSLHNSSLEIFDRWGQSVYQSNHYLNDWNGAGLSTGVYYYLLLDQCLPHKIVGTITLMH